MVTTPKLLYNKLDRTWKDGLAHNVSPTSQYGYYLDTANSFIAIKTIISYGTHLNRDTIDDCNIDGSCNDVLYRWNRKLINFAYTSFSIVNPSSTNKGVEVDEQINTYYSSTNNQFAQQVDCVYEDISTSPSFPMVSFDGQSSSISDG